MGTIPPPAYIAENTLFNLPLFRFATVLLLVMPALASADWWTPSDDERLRYSIQSLADMRCLDIPATTWPLPWSDLSGLEDESLPGHCYNAARTYVLAERARANGAGIRYGVSLSGADEAPLWRSFASTPRERAMVSAVVGLEGEYVDVRLQGSRADSDVDEARLDGSYLATAAGNWALGVGSIDRWWGPGWHSSLILSHNARPAPSLFISRLRSTPFEHDWLQWVGPWHATFFVSQLEHQRVPSRAQLIGMRATFRPAEGLEIGLTRMLQWAGDGRPKGADTMLDMLLGRDNTEDPDLVVDDPSDQKGGFDVRYSTRLGSSTIAFYGQMIGEDEAGYMPSRYLSQFGVEASTGFGAGGQLWILEASDTLAGGWFGENHPGKAYEHHTYHTGWRYKGRNMASTWERDAEVVVLAARQFFANQHELGLTLAHARLNRESILNPLTLAPVPPQGLANTLESTGIIGANYRLPLLHGYFTLAAQHATKAVPMVAGRPERTSVSVSWEFRPTLY